MKNLAVGPNGPDTSTPMARTARAGQFITSHPIRVTRGRLLMATWISFALTFLPGSAGAEPLNLRDVLARVLRDSPALAVYPYYTREAEARALQAGLKPNPELSLEVENIGGGGEFSGTDAAEVTLALSQVIEMGGKRNRRRQVAQLGGEVIARDYELARLDVLARAANQFLAIAEAEQVLAFSQQAVEWATVAEATAQARFEAGSSSRAVLSQARIEAMQAQLAVTEAQTRLENALRRLASLWGSQDVDFAGVEADVFDMSEIPAFAQLRDRLQESPELQRYLTLGRLREAEWELAKSRGRQDIALGAGIKQFEDQGEQAFVLEFSMPLGVFDRNQGNIRAAREAMDRLAVERGATEAELWAELGLLYGNLSLARETALVLRQQALPEAEQALQQVQAGYRSGRFTYLELVEARRQRLQVERTAISAAVEFHRVLIALEQLTGAAIAIEARSIQSPSTPNSP